MTARFTLGKELSRKAVLRKTSAPKTDAPSLDFRKSLVKTLVSQFGYTEDFAPDIQIYAPRPTSTFRLPTTTIKITSAPRPSFFDPKKENHDLEISEAYTEAMTSAAWDRFMNQPGTVAIRQQQALFMAVREGLYAKYEGKYVAFSDGQILDFDADERALLLRTRPLRQERPVLVISVRRDYLPAEL